MDCLNHMRRPLLAGLFVLVLATSANATTLNVPADYSTIQAAVNAAAAGDTILVQSGTYYEHVIVNKQLTLQGVDSGSGLPVVNAGGSGNAITLSANGCTLQGFVASNSGPGDAGIRLISSSNTILGNTATSNGYGIGLVSSSGNTISGNTATGNTNYGIYLYSSSNNDISGNTATGNFYGIYLSTSSNNDISGNTATANSNSGIRLESSSNNAISGNTANNHGLAGIFLYSSSNGNTITGNTATGNYQGIYLYSSSNNDITGNNATGNYYGIFLYSSSNGNTITGNTATGNGYGIYLDSSSSNIIYLNTFNSGYSNGANTWNSTTKIAHRCSSTYVGNRWSSYSGIDSDGDGIGDSPYIIPGGSEKDLYPITDNYDPRILTVCASGCGYTTIQAAINAACPGDTILVQSGTYYEHVLVNKTLILQGVDSGSGLPVVDGGGSGGAITLSADGCTLEGFAARNSGSDNSGITVSSSSNTVSGNTVSGSNHRGIYLNSSSGNTVSGNTVSGASQHGIYLTSSSNNNISSNTANDNSGSGIYLSSSSNSNTVSANTASNNQYGIRLYASNGNTITGNTANNNDDGFRISTATGNTIKGNTANNNSDRGIYLASSSNNNIIWDNTATGNDYGIYLGSSSNGNTINGNIVTGNPSYGIYLLSSSGNIIYLNTLDSGDSNAANYWNSTTEIAYENNTTYVGNNWSDYDGFDCDGDGIGDTPYPVAGGPDIDYHPIGGILCSPGLEAEKSADRSEAEVGDWINYTIQVNNTGNVNLTDVRAEDNLTGAVWNVGTLEPGQNYTNTTRYQVNLSDLPGPLINELQANGTDPCGGEVNDSAIETVNITGQRLTCISGYKLDGCGEPLEGWTIFVDSDRNGTLDSGEPANVTDASGYWQICDLEPGVEVRVAEQAKAGWRASQPSTGWQDITIQPANGTSYVNFTNIQLLCISGYKLDENNAPLEDWNITLTNGSYTNSTLTDSSGKYEFCGLEPGDYALSEEMQEGWMAVSSPGTVELNCTNVTDRNFVNRKLLCINGTKISNCTGEGIEGRSIKLYSEFGLEMNSTTTDVNGDYSFCNLEAGNYTVCEVLQGGWKNVTARCIDVVLDTGNSEDNDFLNTPPVCISGSKINDCTDQGIPGWKITLYDAVGNVIDDTITDANGRYSFCNLTQGIYYVCEEERDGWILVREDRRTYVPSDDTSQPATCNMPWCDDNCVCVDLDCDGAEVNFRNIPKSLCINGSKINNCTGAGIEKWGIYLYDSSGKQIAATQTDRNGHYSFCGLPPGEYRVCEEIRDGYIPVTHINQSGASCLPEDCTCDVCNNCIPVILDCENSDGNDFENIPPLSIRGKVIDDCTGLGLKGWTVKLYDGATQLTTRTTGADGSYTFTSSTTSGGLKLTAGKLYTVCEVVQDGYTPVTYHADNSSPAMSNEYCVPVFLDCGETEVEDFENIPPLVISGHEFNHCTGEGLEGWTVHLKDGAGNILETTTTDDAGYYEFSGRQPGWYTVCEDEIPEGWTSFRDDPKSPAMALPGTSAASEDCERPKCIVVRLDYCEDSTDNDFENIPTFCIKGIVYNNSTEVTGFPVKIENSDGNQIMSIPTDEYGEYSFCGLKAGTYTVCVDKPGWTADEPCVIVYLDCMDEEHDFDVYMGRNNLVPGITQPAISLDDSRAAMDPGAISAEPSEPTEPVLGGDEEEGRQPAAPEIA